MDQLNPIVGAAKRTGFRLQQKTDHREGIQIESRQTIAA